MTLYALGPDRPSVHEDTWVAPDANLIGKVVLEAGASVWFGTTIRADHEEIRIGAGSNVQENCVFHIDAGFPLTIGKGCTIEAGAIVMPASALLQQHRQVAGAWHNLRPVHHVVTHVVERTHVGRTHLEHHALGVDNHPVTQRLGRWKSLHAMVAGDPKGTSLKPNMVLGRCRDRSMLPLF